jgi:hypothetical protein
MGYALLLFINDQQDPSSLLGRSIVDMTAPSNPSLNACSHLRKLKWKKLWGIFTIPCNPFYFFWIHSAYSLDHVLAQSCALWNTRNKFTIERKVINHHAGIIYKTVIFCSSEGQSSREWKRKGWAGWSASSGNVRVHEAKNLKNLKSWSFFYFALFLWRSVVFLAQVWGS